MTQQPIISIPGHSLARAGEAAARIAFDEYRGNRSAQTLRAQQTDLANFAALDGF